MPRKDGQGPDANEWVILEQKKREFASGRRSARTAESERASKITILLQTLRRRPRWQAWWPVKPRSERAQQPAMLAASPLGRVLRLHVLCTDRIFYVNSLIRWMSRLCVSCTPVSRPALALSIPRSQSCTLWSVQDTVGISHEMTRDRS